MAGGFDGNEVLDTVELYSPHGTCNFEIAPLPIRTYGLFCFVYEDKVYCCGGMFGTGDTCYGYTAGRNGDGNWDLAPEKTLNQPRLMASVAKSPVTGVVFVR